MNTFLIGLSLGVILSIIHLVYKWKKLDYPTAFKLNSGFIITNSIMFGLFMMIMFFFGSFSTPSEFKIYHFLVIGLLSLAYLPTILLKEIVDQNSPNEPVFKIRKHESIS